MPSAISEVPMCGEVNGTGHAGLDQSDSSEHRKPPVAREDVAKSRLSRFSTAFTA